MATRSASPVPVGSTPRPSTLNRHKSVIFPDQYAAQVRERSGLPSFDISKSFSSLPASHCSDPFISPSPEDVAPCNCAADLPVERHDGWSMTHLVIGAMNMLVLSIVNDVSPDARLWMLVEVFVATTVVVILQQLQQWRFAVRRRLSLFAFVVILIDLLRIATVVVAMADRWNPNFPVYIRVANALETIAGLVRGYSPAEFFLHNCNRRPRSLQSLARVLNVETLLHAASA